MIQQARAHESIKTLRIGALSNEELGEIVDRCQAALADGSAEIADYEKLVKCEKELARRTWS